MVQGKPRRSRDSIIEREVERCADNLREAYGGEEGDFATVGSLLRPFFVMAVDDAVGEFSDDFQQSFDKQKLSLDHNMALVKSLQEALDNAERQLDDARRLIGDLYLSGKLGHEE